MQRLGHPSSILFICYGNICRSPYAAGYFQERFARECEPEVKVASAGLYGPNRPSPKDAVAVAAARGVDLKRHRSRLATGDIVGSADLVIVMDPNQSRDIQRLFGYDASRIVVLGDLDPEPIAARIIIDPVEGPLEAFQECYLRIDHCLNELASAVGCQC